jgi:hypothetical protein
MRKEFGYLSVDHGTKVRVICAFGNNRVECGEGCSWTRVWELVLGSHTLTT